MYQPRIYRNNINRDRFQTFTLQHLESDILVGTDHGSWNISMKSTCMEIIKKTRQTLDSYGDMNPAFITSHEPLTVDPDAPAIARRMMACGLSTHTGPMSSVAGLFAQEIGSELVTRYHVNEMIIENGGDIFLMNQVPMHVAVFAGDSPLSNRLSFEIPPGTRGISTSSGTVGHSFSYGIADAVTVICNDPVLSDAWATALANKIQKADDVEKTLQLTETISEILGCMIIFRDKAGVRGMFKIKPVDSL